MDWLVLVAALALLTASAEVLVRAASLLALRAGWSPLFVGLTVVGMGTSAPELGSSLAASWRGSGELSVGNVVGSNLFNATAILGLTALLAPIRAELSAVGRSLRVALLVSVLPFVALLNGGSIGPVLGALFLAGFCGYVVLELRAARRSPAVQSERADEELRTTFDVGRFPQLLDTTWVNVLGAVAALGGLLVGSTWFVDAAIDLATQAGVEERVIGLTVVAIGTSLPELVTSVVAALRGNPDVALGNVLGSNVFNVLGVLGAASLVHPQSLDPATATVDLPLMVLVTALLLPIVRSGSRISRPEGLALLALYLGYAAWAIGAGG